MYICTHTSVGGGGGIEDDIITRAEGLMGEQVLASSESGPLRAVHLSRHKWPGGLVDQDSGRLSESI